MYVFYPFSPSASPLVRAPRARPRDRRHERPLSQHGGLWYHLWVGRRRGWARSERRALGQILSGARGHARGRIHHSVSEVTSVAAVCRAVALLPSVCPSLAWLAATVSRREPQLGAGKMFGLEHSYSAWQKLTSVSLCPPYRATYTQIISI